MVSTPPVAPAPPLDEPDSDVTSEMMEPSPPPPELAPAPPPPEEPPNSPDTAWILGPSSCSLGPTTCDTTPPSDASPFCGASMPYCLFFSMFCLSSVSIRRVFASIRELIFCKMESALVRSRSGRSEASLVITVLAITQLPYTLIMKRCVTANVLTATS